MSCIYQDYSPTIEVGFQPTLDNMILKVYFVKIVPFPGVIPPSQEIDPRVFYSIFRTSLKVSIHFKLYFLKDYIRSFWSFRGLIKVTFRNNSMWKIWDSKKIQDWNDGNLL